MKIFNNTDDATVYALTSNHLNTDNQVVANSVATALLDIAPDHFGARVNHQQLQLELEHCIGELKRRSKMHPEYAVGIETILKKVTEKNDQFDIVTLYYPTHKIAQLTGVSPSSSSTVEYSDVQLTLPLSTVLTVVWNAINSDLMYRHHYSGNSIETICNAFIDKRNRLETFFNMLNRLSTQTVCHQGVRHELVFTLNKIYKNVDIIEDARATVLAYLRDNMNRDFFAAFEQADAAKKKILFKALLSWIEGETAEVLRVVNKQQFYTNELHQLFAKHSCNSRVEPVKNIIDDAYNFTSFSCSPTEQALFWRVNTIFNDPHTLINSARGSAVRRMVDWIKSDFDPNNTRQHAMLTIFTTLLAKHDMLNQFASLLVISGNLPQQQCEQLKLLCDNYFNLVVESVDNAFMPSKLLVEFQPLSTAIKNLENKFMHAEISSFFKMYFVARNEEFVKLYQMLINPKFQSMVIWENKQQLEKQIETTRIPNGNERNVTPYEINRVFLHAIIQKPMEWFPEFAVHLESMLKFVENYFNHDQSSNALLLRRDSYPNEIIAQIQYRLGCYKVLHNSALEMPTRPNHKIVFPDDIESVTELKRMAKVLTSQQLKDAYRVHQQKYFNIFLKQYQNDFYQQMQDYFSHIQAMPLEYAILYLKKLLDKDHRRDGLIFLLSQSVSVSEHAVQTALAVYPNDQTRCKDLVFIRNQRGESELHLLIKNSRPEFIQSILTYFATGEILFTALSSADKCGNNCLHLASMNTQNPLEILLAAIPDKNNQLTLLNKKNCFGRTPLHQAALFGDGRSYQSIIKCYQSKEDKIAALNVTDSYLMTPLFFAAKFADLTRFKACLACYPNEESKQAALKMKSEDHSSILHIAANNNHKDARIFAEILFELGSIENKKMAIESTDSKDNTALHFAAMYNTDVVTLIVDCYTDKKERTALLHKKNKNGHTALVNSFFNGNKYEIMQKILLAYEDDADRITAINGFNLEIIFQSISSVESIYNNFFQAVCGSFSTDQGKLDLFKALSTKLTESNTINISIILNSLSSDESKLTAIEICDAHGRNPLEIAINAGHPEFIVTFIKSIKDEKNKLQACVSLIKNLRITDLIRLFGDRQVYSFATELICFSSYTNNPVTAILFLEKYIEALSASVQPDAQKSFIKMYVSQMPRTAKQQIFLALLSDVTQPNQQCFENKCREWKPHLFKSVDSAMPDNDDALDNALTMLL